ncbi:SNF2-related protein [Secundilactobacillus paracollinoides]|uniref:SNF2-related protein n=1 Tax=Secundilactobacillus paracollinoides TaxID=240427 RepID=UPI0006D1D3F0|nr:SNF2-related protein [Secundilactobacillus paracollinoides]KRL77503.1 Snf2 family protein [Secundilactobacillus paracollinoides DSM 15502 = JCM 11969]
MARNNMPDVIWQRGRDIVKNGKAQIDFVDNEREEVDGTIFGTDAYGVTLAKDSENDFCECPYFPEHGYCKHLAALEILLRQQHRDINGLFVDLDIADQLQIKNPENSLSVGFKFESELAKHPNAADVLYRDKARYNALRATPDQWADYFKQHDNDEVTPDTPKQRAANAQQQAIEDYFNGLNHHADDVPEPDDDIDYASLYGSGLYDDQPTEPSRQMSTAESFLLGLNIPQKTYFKPLTTTDADDRLKLEVTLLVGSLGWGWDNSEARFFIQLRVGSDGSRFYVIKDIESFLTAYQEEAMYQTGGRKQFNLTRDHFLEPEAQLMDHLVALSGTDNGIPLEDKKKLLLNPGVLTQIKADFAQLQYFDFEIEESGLEYDHFNLEPFDAKQGLLEATVTKVGSGYDLTLTENFNMIVPSEQVVIKQDTLYQMTTQQVSQFNRVTDSYARRVSHLPAPNRHIHFGLAEVNDLIDFINFINDIAVVDLPDALKRQNMVVHFDLSNDAQVLKLKLGYEYDGQLYDTDTVKTLPDNQRNIEQENQSASYLEDLGFVYENGGWEKDCTDTERLYQFFVAELPNLRSNGKVTVSDSLQNLVRSGDTLTPDIQVSEGDGLLSVNFSFAGIDDDQVDDMLEQLDVNRPYIQRPDGTLVLLDDKLRRVSGALKRIRREGNMHHGQVQVHAAQAMAVQAALGQDAQFNQTFKRLTNDLAHPESFNIAHEAPVNATLRPYQTIGVKWLEMLDSHGFGGILADEMGLGKTIQMITLLNNHLNHNHIDLVVSPASLIYNWLEEFKKFAPNIRAVVVDGSKENRREIIADQDADVLITSYNSARLDISMYQESDLDYLVLDEAQFVKNSGTKTNQSLRKLMPKNTFALSGTPIENRAEELWSIFALVMPGLLPNKRAFKKLTAEEIAVRVKPFILRREKAAVLKDLPPKVESNLTNEMTEAQKTVYLAQLKQMQVKVRGLSSQAFVKNKIEILAGLTRLRQICDTPALYMDDYEGESGKLEQLNELIRQAVDSDRHILIFSQFTTMLSIIEDELKDSGLPTYVLKGDTKPKDRLAMVDAFNRGENNIFLISLKAGGTGLNLTGADMVILVDLWWNPAVEDQATARAHRIGQKNTVEVYRLITKGTIEEQIYKLQEKKRNFVDQVLSGTQNKGSLTDDEIRLILGIE